MGVSLKAYRGRKTASPNVAPRAKTQKDRSPLNQTSNEDHDRGVFREVEVLRTNEKRKFENQVLQKKNREKHNNRVGHWRIWRITTGKETSWGWWRVEHFGIHGLKALTVDSDETQTKMLLPTQREPKFCQERRTEVEIQS